MTTKSEAPENLGTEAQRLWDDVTGVYSLRPDERRLLEDACREIDLIETLRLSLPKDRRRLLVRGSMGQQVAHPILGELRQHRATLASLLKQLKLADLGEAAADGGKPAASDTSTSARRAAIAKWGRAGG